MKGKKVIYLELLGKSLTYSINYEKYVFEKNNIKIGLRAGLSFFKVSNHISFFSIPYGVQFLIGEKKGHFEISYGHTLFLVNYLQKYNGNTQNGFLSIAQNLSFGYKFIPLSRNGFTFSPFASIFFPLFISDKDHYNYSFVHTYSTGFTPILGFQIGYLF
ncbi:MAG: hypothetical protein EAZ27_13215 [Cytophagales bacterium]|nr:MAG: hypothetical protein EAZ27_13215 [Cytophagales bacterium]